jgi:hypothetical protein
MYPLLARVITALPLRAERIVRQQTSRTNFVCTNAPGPRQPCYLAGEEIEPIVGRQADRRVSAPYASGAACRARAEHTGVVTTSPPAARAEWSSWHFFWAPCY